jgi:hypothetical protein
MGFFINKKSNKPTTKKKYSQDHLFDAVLVSD